MAGWTSIGCCLDAGGGRRSQPRPGEPAGTSPGSNQVADQLGSIRREGRPMALQRPTPAASSGWTPSSLPPSTASSSGHNNGRNSSHSPFVSSHCHSLSPVEVDGGKGGYGTVERGFLPPIYSSEGRTSPPLCSREVGSQCAPLL